MFGLFSYSPKQLDARLFSEPSLSETYREILRKHSTNKINQIIENDTFEDSSSVYERFFYDCRNKIRIVARGIKSEIFDRPNVIGAAKRYLMNDGARLILDLSAKDIDDVSSACTTEFFRAISDAASGSEKLKITFYHEELPGAFLRDLPSVSFGDGRMYRKRTYQSGGDYTAHANADVNFNDPDSVKQLEQKTDAALKELEIFGGFNP